MMPGMCKALGLIAKLYHQNQRKKDHLSFSKIFFEKEILTTYPMPNAV